MKINLQTLGLALAVFAASGCVALTGCGRGYVAAANGMHLQDVSGYPMLVPDVAPSPSGGGFQKTVIALGPTAISQAERCSVTGRVFSLTAPLRQGSGWTVTSPTPQGWQAPLPDVDLSEDWHAFVRSLAALQEAGCFRLGMDASRAQQMISEAIPIPADEALVFRYGFTGRGVVDLLPGMMLQVERSVLVDKGARRELQSMEADYEVVSGATGGVRLHRTRAISLHRPQTVEEIFHLERLTGDAPMLRLFLQSAAAGASMQRPSVLIAATRRDALEASTRTVDSSGCSAPPAVAVKCITFHEAVSLLMECTINGKKQYLPLGTALTSLLEVQRGPGSTESVARRLSDGRYSVGTVSVMRHLSDGRYARLEFANTQEAAGHIILQSGDRVSWR